MGFGHGKALKRRKGKKRKAYIRLSACAEDHGHGSVGSGSVPPFLGFGPGSGLFQLQSCPDKSTHLAPSHGMPKSVICAAFSHTSLPE